MMSSKISTVYYLTAYSFGRTIQVWPKSRFKATSANGANTHGFQGKGMTKNPRCVHAVNRLIGTPRASQIAKRQSGRNRKRPEAYTSSRLANKLLRQNYARLAFTGRALTFSINKMRISRGCCVGGNPNHRLLLSRSGR
jgi:hypothetical protein